MNGKHLRAFWAPPAASDKASLPVAPKRFYASSPEFVGEEFGFGEVS